MPTYPPTIRRCQHIKVNGIQCGSPAVNKENFCYFHDKARVLCRQINMRYSEVGVISLPTLEDANSIQFCISEVMRMLCTHQIDHRIASLILRGLTIAAANVKFVSLEPKQATQIVIDTTSVANRPLGASAWSTIEGREYDLQETNNADATRAATNQPDLKEDGPDHTAQPITDNHELKTENEP